MNLLLKYQNDEFKYFKDDNGSSLQEIDIKFWLHTLLVDFLKQIWPIINKIVIEQEQKGHHPKKNTLFDVFSLAD